VFGIELPVIQAPMAGVQGWALAAAVSNAGGLGSLPCAMLTPEDMRRELTHLAAQTNQPYSVNFFCHTMPEPDAAREEAWRGMLAPYYRELGIEPPPIQLGTSRTPFDAAAASVLDDFKPAVVSFHFGLPTAELLKRVRAHGATILATATSVEEARWLEAHGADAIIAQGFEAGGHRGNFLSVDMTRQIGTFALLPQVVKAVSVPVVGAGGIADAEGVRAAIALGAAAVQIGTTYLLCHEATTGAVHRAALTGDEAHHTAITNLFSGRPARSIVNRLMRDLGSIRPEIPEFPLAAAALAPLRAKAEAGGRADFSPLWAGQNVTGCRPIGAGVMTRELAR
jgi:nitronate monooxygenase